MVCTRDGRHAYIGGNDGLIRKWDLEEGTQLAQFKDPHHCTLDIKLSPDERLLASGGDDKIVRVWDARTGELICRGKGHTNSISEVAFSPSGRWVASVAGDGTIRAWDCRTGEELRKFKHEEFAVGQYKYSYDRVRAVTVSRDGTQIVAGGAGSGASVWDVDEGRRTGVFKGHVPQLLNPVKLTGGETYAPRTSFAMNGSIRNLHNSDLMISVGWDKAVRIWSSRTLREVGRFTIPFSTWRFAVSDDGRRAVFGGDKGVLHVWALPQVTR